MPGSIQVTKRTSATFTSSFTLGDLRTFLQACDGVAASARVQIEHYTSRDQRDPSTTTITVHGAA